jgi:hypothetical protein
MIHTPLLTRCRVYRPWNCGARLAANAAIASWASSVRDMTELRAAMSLACLWQQQGKKEEARQMLAAI